MDKRRYNVVLTGKIEDGRLLSIVAADLAKLINRDESFAASLLRGQATAIKSGVSADVAEKYVGALRRIGVNAKVEPQDAIEIDEWIGRVSISNIADTSAAKAHRPVQSDSSDTSLAKAISTSLQAVSPKSGASKIDRSSLATNVATDSERKRTFNPRLGFVLAAWLILMGGGFKSAFREPIAAFLGFLLVGTIIAVVIHAVGRWRGRVKSTTMLWDDEDGSARRIKPLGALPNTLLVMLFLAAARHYLGPSGAYTSYVYWQALAFCTIPLGVTAAWNTVEGDVRWLQTIAVGVTAAFFLGLVGMQALNTRTPTAISLSTPSPNGQLDPSTATPSGPESISATLVGTWDCQSTNSPYGNGSTVLVYNADGTIESGFRWQVLDDEMLYEQNPFSTRPDGYLQIRLAWKSLTRFDRTVVETGLHFVCKKRNRQ